MGKSEAPQTLVSTIRYFKVGNAECTVCREPGSVVRLAITLTNQILVTMMCADCGGAEIDGLLEREEMSASPDGSSLVSKVVADQLQDALSAHSLSASGDGIQSTTPVLDITPPDPKPKRSADRYRGWTRKEK